MLPTLIENYETATRQLSNFKAKTTYSEIDDLKTKLEENCKKLRSFQRMINNFRITKKDAATEMSQISNYIEKFQHLITKYEIAKNECERKFM